ncbi:hypothetical protein Herbaro_13850 [Herbaspirillum sp. WKF16]|nr:hypothetical protein [Herbaspirillum sp. WKF16]WDZ98444.1 hypothetical protein Herbaro_13850 [Herbaspirillum sp. WKF16]
MDKNYMQGFFADAKGASRLLCGLLLAGAAGLSAAQTAAISGPSLPEVDKSVATAPAGPVVTMAPERFAELDARAPLNQRYPAGSINSGDVAQKALDEAKEDREAVNVRYVIDQRACYRKFMVNACLDEAKDRRRAAEKSIKQVEVEANTYQRQANVDERDRSLAEQRAKDEQDSARRLQEQKDKEAASARKVQESNAKNREVQQRIDQNKDLPPDYRIREHEAKVRQQQAEDAAKAPERAANAAAREQRIKDAEAHRLDVERKKAENERERAERKKRQEPPATTAPAAQ